MTVERKVMRGVAKGAWTSTKVTSNVLWKGVKASAKEARRYRVSRVA